MKHILLALSLLLSANAFAAPGDCEKLAYFKENQEQKLALSQYGLRMINAAQWKAQLEHK